MTGNQVGGRGQRCQIKAVPSEARRVFIFLPRISSVVPEMIDLLGGKLHLSVCGGGGGAAR